MGEWPIMPPIKPMEARVRETFPRDTGWAFEPKWDGFRALAWSGEPRLDSRNTRPLLRYFPELREPLGALPAGTVVDCEVIVVTEGRLDFEALSQRIHPAESRIAKLSEETPAQLVTFDVLAVRGTPMLDAPYAERRAALLPLLDELKAASPSWQLTPATEQLEVAERWFEAFEAAGCDGIVAKRLDGRYEPGERRMLKIKQRHTVDVVVGGYRLHKNGDQVGALLLGMYDELGALHFVGHCASFSEADRAAMLEQFRRLETDESFGAEARRPEMEHRWSGQRDRSWIAVEPVVVMEVSHDQISGRRFRHASRFLRWRPDKPPEACTLDQMDLAPGHGIDEVWGAAD